MFTETTKTRLKNVSYVLVFLLMIPILIVGTFQDHYIVSLTLLLLDILALFFIRFEKSAPAAVEILLLASMTALVVVGNLCSVSMLFQAGTALVILSGIAFGAEFGFLVGALARWIINFFYTQGSWTLWQMVAWGILGFVAGVLFKKGRIPKKWFYISAFGFLGTLVLYGGIMDTYTAIYTIGSNSPETVTNAQSIVSVYIAGFYYNLLHAVGTTVFLLLFSYLLLSVFDRLIRKFGLRENA